MEDLDSLLEDLGRGKSTSSTKKNRPPSSRVDLNELENLMEDLGAAPTPKPTPAPAPVSYNATVNSTFTPPAASSARSSTASPPPAAAANMDDLDALMESLNASSSRNSRRVPAAATPSSNPAPQKNAVAAAPKQTTSAVHNERPATNNFSQPQERRPDPMPERRPDPMPNRNTQPAPKVAPASRKGDALDDLLSNLNTQMNSIDTDNPASRGTCWTCRGAILGEVIQALGKTFHPEHFQCGNCRNPLGTSNFYEANGTPQCEDCYQQLFCPKCAHCDGPVLDRCITALGKKWHVDHFICTSCLKPFQGGNFFERDGRPYCEKDFYGLYAAKCAGCGEAIKGDCINALGSQWHPEHFSCSYCQKSFAGGSFFEYGGKPYCEIHYHQQTGSLCAGCGKAITGRCVNALEKKWHPEHFVCAFCMNPLAGGSFTEHNNKAYCKECHGKLWSNP